MKSVSNLTLWTDTKNNPNDKPVKLERNHDKKYPEAGCNECTTKLIQKRCYKKFNDMRKYNIKITYNTMGERVKSEVKVDCEVIQKRRIPPKQRLNNPTMSESKKVNMTYSSMDLIRTIHVLREILLGKLSRDIMYSRSCDDYSLEEMLRFYCQTSFGTITIAESRQADLFNAVLGLQDLSPFIRTMKRLLHIPDVKPWSKRIEIVYFKAWIWVLKHDAFIFVNMDVYHHQLTPFVINMKLKRFLISEAHLTDCLRSIQNDIGSFSPLLIDNLMNHVHRLHKYKQPDHNLEVCYFDVDEVLELALTMMEDNDFEMAKVHNQLFGENVSYIKTLTPTVHGASHQSNDEVKFYNCNLNFRTALREVKTVLNQCIEADQNREGRVHYMHFRQIIRDWYRRTNNLDKFVHSQFKKMFEIFMVNDDSIAAVDYIEFVGVVYTILLEEKSIPFIDEILMYFSEPQRGIESFHVTLLKEYVLKASYTNMSSFSTCSDNTSTKKMTPIQDHNAARETRRMISKIESFRNHSDFLSRWLKSGSLRKEYQNVEQRPPLSPSRHNVSSQERTKHDKQKTPLNLINPQPCFDSNYVRT